MAMFGAGRRRCVTSPADAAVHDPHGVVYVPNVPPNRPSRTSPGTRRPPPRGALTRRRVLYAAVEADRIGAGAPILSLPAARQPPCGASLSRYAGTSYVHP